MGRLLHARSNFSARQTPRIRAREPDVAAPKPPLEGAESPRKARRNRRSRAPNPEKCTQNRSGPPNSGGSGVRRRFRIPWLLTAPPTHRGIQPLRQGCWRTVMLFDANGARLYSRARVGRTRLDEEVPTMAQIAMPIVGIAVCAWAICRVVAARWRPEAARNEIARQMALPATHRPTTRGSVGCPACAGFSRLPQPRERPRGNPARGGHSPPPKPGGQVVGRKATIGSHRRCPGPRRPRPPTRCLLQVDRSDGGTDGDRSGRVDEPAFPADRERQTPLEPCSAPA